MVCGSWSSVQNPAVGLNRWQYRNKPKNQNTTGKQKTEQQLTDEEVTYTKRIIKEKETASYDKAIKYLTSKLPKDA